MRSDKGKRRRPTRLGCFEACIDSIEHRYKDLDSVIRIWLQDSQVYKLSTGLTLNLVYIFWSQVTYERETKQEEKNARNDEICKIN